MATTCELIAKNVLTGTAADVTFSTIPATYDDLWLVCSIRSNRAALEAAMGLRVNGDTGNNYSWRRLQGSGSAASSSSGSSQSDIFIGAAAANTSTADTFSSLEIYIPNYAGSTNKSVSSTNCHETNGSQAFITAVAGLWSSGSAITSVTVRDADSANFIADSSFYLYGIKKA